MFDEVFGNRAGSVHEVVWVLADDTFQAVELTSGIRSEAVLPFVDVAF